MKLCFLMSKPGRYFFTGILISLFLGSCKPRIYSFEVSPLTMWPTDSLKINWKAKGEGAIMVNDQFYGKDTVYRVVTLAVRRNGREIARHQQVQVFKDGGKDMVSFKTIFSGNDLLAEGTKSTTRWGDSFAVWTVSNGSDRPLDISHAGITLHLDTGSSASEAFSGTPVKGEWRLSSRLSPAERADSAHLPSRLKIFITVKHH